MVDNANATWCVGCASCYKTMCLSIPMKLNVNICKHMNISKHSFDTCLYIWVIFFIEKATWYIYSFLYIHLSLSAQDATGARGRAVERTPLATPTVISEKSRVRRSPHPHIYIYVYI